MSAELEIAKEGACLVDFYADWCEPCKWLEPILEEVKDLSAGAYSVVKSDIEAEVALSKQYNIRSVPTLVLFKGGTEVWRMQGFKYSRDLHVTIMKELSRSNEAH